MRVPTNPATGTYSNVSLNITLKTDGMYWGILVSTMLFGITLSQTWTYIHNNRDNWRLRSFVALLILMDFAITCLNWQALRFYLMMNFGDVAVFLTLTPQWACSIILIEIVATLTEWFFASRIYLLNKNSLWAPILACVLAAAGFVSITLAIHSNFVDSSVSQLTSRYEKMLVGVGLGFTLSTVVLITAVLVARLSSVNVNVKKTKSAIQKLLLFCVTRGLLVTLNQIAFLVVYEACDPTSMMWAPFLFLDPKLHIITMMAMLNSRKHSTTSQSAAGAVTSLTSSKHSNPQAINMSPLTNKSSLSVSHSTSIPPAMHLSRLTDKAERYGDELGVDERRQGWY